MADDLDAWLDAGVVRSAEVTVCLRADLIAHHVAAEVELAQTSDKAKRTSLAKRIKKLEEEIAAAEKVFKFEALSPRQYHDLLRAHLPTVTQRTHDPELDHNPDTFPTAIVAAACVDPDLTFEQAEKIRTSNKVDFGEWQKLYDAALKANLEVAAAPKSAVATVILSRNGGSSTTAARKASPDPSS